MMPASPAIFQDSGKEPATLTRIAISISHDTEMSGALATNSLRPRRPRSIFAVKSPDNVRGLYSTKGIR